MRNNQNTPPSKLQQSNLIYKYKCNLDECEHLPESLYIGLTTTTLSRRLTMHLGNGGPKRHSNENHRTNLTRTMLEEQTEIIRKEQDTNRLHIYEAILIQSKALTINNQATGQARTLKLFSLPLITPNIVN